MKNPVPVTRFAPSPSGYLHLGHVLAACEARRLADEGCGQCLLRIEDIDRGRCHDQYIDGIIEDLNWLGLSFDGEIVRQSERMGLYRNALDRLIDLEVVYPCFCTRKEIALELSRMADAPQGEHIELYPKTCKHLSIQKRTEKMNQGVPYAWRLDSDKAFNLVGELTWVDRRFGLQMVNPDYVGDVVLARKDCATSYHLSVVVDDALQGVNLVSRGEDLFEATHVHRLLQELLQLPVPEWYHHHLICDDHGVRLAKRNKSLAIKEMRESGMSPDEVLKMMRGSF